MHHLDAAIAGGADADWLRMRPGIEPPADLAGNLLGTELWIRFLFSALIDADRLDTEHFHDPNRTASRGHGAKMQELADLLDARIDTLAAGARERDGSTSVNAVRAEVLADCRDRASEAKGAFTLTVPTGGGKTLASMSFALRHAAHHGLDRVIVVIPYTSIIEQNAGILRDILGSGNVLEHHSNFDPRDDQKYWLDAENWDMPVVVTTSVQFFESLFANRTSVVRKLHSIARSVVLFDEVQTLPPSLLKPIVEVMGELVARYGLSLVLWPPRQVRGPSRWLSPPMRQARALPRLVTGTNATSTPASSGGLSDRRGGPAYLLIRSLAPTRQARGLLREVSGIDEEVSCTSSSGHLHLCVGTPCFFIRSADFFSWSSGPTWEARALLQLVTGTSATSARASSGGLRD